MQFLGFAVLICLFQALHYSFACGGYDVKLISFESGPKNPTLIVQPNPKIILNKDCQLYLDGCLEVLRPVKCAELSFKANKKGLTLLDGNDIDLCDLLAKSKYTYQCPLQKSEYCDTYRRPLNLSPYKKYLEKVCGKIDVEATVVTNSKEINYFKLKLEIFKKN